ncbi:MAG: OmpA family protein [Deltaproteobacteria bacterium]|nr:OmpA family protein [Deltaproteobacteria bacterium]
MADKGKQGPVIVIKKGGGHGGHHGGAWKVAYADFVTAMMAFFLVMWIVGQSKAVKQHVQGYFQDPVAYKAKVAAGIFDGGQGMLSTGPAVQGQIAPIQEQQVRAALEKAGQEILDSLSEVPGLKDISSQIEVEVTAEGLRIQLMEAGLSTFFDLGSATLSPSGIKTLATIAHTIAPLDMDVAVEGHTDSHAYSGRGGYTNWELSADRANAARRVLEENGVSARHVREIRGYADTRLRYPGSPEDPRNRRISIIVINRFHGGAAAEPLGRPVGTAASLPTEAAPAPSPH